MIDLAKSHIALLRHISDGGLVSLCIYGKRTQTMEVLCRPKTDGAGIKSISYLQELGLVRYGDPSPYKSGKSLPIILTEEGKSAIAMAAL